MKFAIRARRTARSVFGASEAWAKHNGFVMIFDTREAAQAHADGWTRQTKSLNVHYTVHEYPAHNGVIPDDPRNSDSATVHS